MNNPRFQSRSLYESDERPRTSHTSNMRKAALNVPRKQSRISEGARTFIARLLRLIQVRRKDGTKKISFLRIVGWLILAGCVTLFFLWVTLPNIDDPKTLFAAQSTIIYDRNNTELYRLFSEQDRTYISGDKISNDLKNATIAIEDERFLDRGCFDAIGFTRAVVSQFVPGFVRSGGSTLTQQFAKNALVGRQRSLFRKARELLLACKLESRYDKPHLLELYLNWIPYGKNAYGIEQASRTYFGVSAKDLTLPQSVVLAALPQLPSYYNPYGPHVRTQISAAVAQKIQKGQISSAGQVSSKDIAIGLIGQAFGSGANAIYIGGRTDQVIKNMVTQKMITADQGEKTLKDLQSIKFSQAREDIRAPHFVLWIQKQVEQIYGITDQMLTQGGFQITTTLDWNLQQIAEKTVTAHKDDILKRFGAHNAALLSVAPKTHEILAYVGNTDYNDEEHEGKIDMVRSPRQPGSSFKPFVYAAAFEKGYGPGTVIYDVQTKFGENTPQNYEGDFMGMMTMRTALAGSRNIPAIKAFFMAGGEQTVLSMASKMGVTNPSIQKEEYRKNDANFDYGYPLAIGSAEVPLAEMVQGYSTIADGGSYVPLTAILKVTDRDGNILSLPKPPAPQNVLDERIAAELTSVLSDVNARPANEYWRSILSVAGYQAAAKTGTSNKCEKLTADKKDCQVRHPGDTWTMGFTPNIITGVWVGNATSQSLYDKADGLTTAAPIWHDFMVAAQKKIPDVKTTFTQPNGLSQPLLSLLSGQLANACTPVNLRQADLALQENTPTQEDPGCVLVNVDKVTGLLPSDSCPADAVEQRPFLVPQPELPDGSPQQSIWMQGINDWAAKQMEKWNSNDTHSGSLLPLPLAPTQQCDMSATPGRLNHPTVTIMSPSGNENVPYPAFHPRVNIRSVAPIQQVQYLVDDTVIATVTAEPFDPTVRVPRSIDREGTHRFKVIVTDKYFNTATDSIMIGFGAGSSGPQVTVTSPVGGSSVTKGEAVTISAQAEDLAGIDRVEFYLDDTLLTIKRTAPYQFSYKIDTVGSHRIRATAYNSNKIDGQDEVTVNVQ